MPHAITIKNIFTCKCLILLQNNTSYSYLNFLYILHNLKLILFPKENNMRLVKWSVVFYGYYSLLHQQNWPPRYDIIEILLNMVLNTISQKENRYSFQFTDICHIDGWINITWPSNIMQTNYNLSCADLENYTRVCIRQMSLKCQTKRTVSNNGGHLVPQIFFF
jgi:hypothetical protein